MPAARIQQHFIDSAELTYQAAEPLAGSIAQAVQALLACVTSGGKVLACGAGASAPLATLFCHAFVEGFERPRPGLAALALGLGGGAAGCARQVEALGHAGDVLLLLACTAGGADPLADAAVHAAVRAAHERDMSVVAFTGREPGAAAALLRETDAHIAAPHLRAARVQEAHLLALHSICDAVDAQLLGEQETLP